MPAQPSARRLERLRPRGALHLRRADATVIPALLAGVGMGAPLLFLYAAGHLELLVFAAFGGFTSLYGRNEPYAVRAPMLAAVGAFLVLSVAIGTVTAALTDQFWVTVPVVAVFAGAAKLLADASHVGPPAGLMPVFGIAVCAELPLQAESILPAVATAAAVAAWCWLVSMSGRLVRPHGPERVAVARALEAIAERVQAVGTPAEPAARHRGGLALQRGWHAVGTNRRRSASVRRLEALCAYAESAMHRARHAHEAALARRTRPQGVEGARDEGDGGRPVFDTAALLELARQLRGFGRIPVLPATPEEAAGLEHRRAAVDLLDLPSRDGQMSRHPGPRRWGSSVLDLRPSSPYVPLALRVLVAALVASALSHAVGLGHTSWAAVSATAVLQSVNRTSTLNRGVQRAVGTGGGLLVGVALLALSPGAGGTILLVIGFQVLAELVVMVNYAFALVFATPVALLLAHLGHAIPASALVRDRLVDTLIGAAIGVLCAVLIPNRRLAGTLRQAMHQTAAAIERARPIAGPGRQALGPNGAGAGAAGPPGSDPLVGDEQRSAPTEERLRLARELALALSRMRGAYDAAAGEPWPEDLPAESFLRLERHGFRELARLTAGRQDQTP